MTELLFLMMKVMKVRHFVRDSDMVTTALIVKLPSIFLLWRFLSKFKDVQTK
jgi:hypothetical protein